MNRIGGGIIGIHVEAELGEELRAPVDGARRGTVFNYRNDVERRRSHVEEHSGDVNERSEEKNALSSKQNREEHPAEPLRGGPTAPPARREPPGLGLPCVAEPRRAERRRRRRRRRVPAAW